MKNPIVTIKIKNHQEIKLELYPEKAPNTVNNFLSLTKKGFYDGIIFHRVIKGFMIQGGDPQGIGIGGPGYHIKGEFNSNGYDNDLLHTRGTISMARSGHPDSAGSQFFIMHHDAPHLNGQYAAFGRVIDGIEEVDRIANVQTNHQDKPIENQIIESIIIEFQDYNFSEPEILQ